MEQKQKWFGDKWNERRRERYENDPEYRKKAIMRARKTYREKHGVEMKDCSSNLDNLGQIGTIRPVVLGKKTVDRLSFNVAEMGEVLGRSAVSLYHWFSNDQFPKPVFETGFTGGGNLNCKVYTEQEVIALVEVYSEHQSRKAYFRKTDTDTINRLHSAVKKLRR